MSHASIPHFAFPFALGTGGHFGVVEQDTIDEIAQNVGVILRTRIGERIDNVDFGTSDLVFETSAEATRAAVVEAVEEWEPRAAVLVDVAPDRFDELVRHVTVHTSNVGGV